ncbi:hypothetical protein V8E51_002980 [Hyaloscypha variabilis]
MDMIDNELDYASQKHNIAFTDLWGYLRHWFLVCEKELDYLIRAGPLAKPCIVGESSHEGWQKRIYLGAKMDTMGAARVCRH